MYYGEKTFLPEAGDLSVKHDAHVDNEGRIGD